MGELFHSRAFLYNSPPDPLSYLVVNYVLNKFVFSKRGGEKSYSSPSLRKIISVEFRKQYPTREGVRG